METGRWVSEQDSEGLWWVHREGNGMGIPVTGMDSAFSLEDKANHLDNFQLRELPDELNPGKGK